MASPKPLALAVGRGSRRRAANPVTLACNYDLCDIRNIVGDTREVFAHDLMPSRSAEESPVGTFQARHVNRLEDNAHSVVLVSMNPVGLNCQLVERQILKSNQPRLKWFRALQRRGLKLECTYGRQALSFKLIMRPRCEHRVAGRAAWLAHQYSAIPKRLFVCRYQHRLEEPTD